MNLSPTAVVLVTIGIIALSAFFVAVEFALLAARRHRLEDRARESRSARAALRNASQMTVLLAGAQLGITACTLILGAVTKPAVHDWLTPAFENFGLPEVTADVIAFILALLIVTFLHLVVGEMAPKSWAIAHPEMSATLLALPMRGFLILTRPLLVGLNNAANWLLQRVGVSPVNAVSAAQDTNALRQLVRHSEDIGTLDTAYSTRVAAALEMQSTPVSTLVPQDTSITMVPPTASVADVRAATEATGHHRIIVGTPDRIVGSVHIRDTLTRPTGLPIQRLIRPVLRLQAHESIHEALARMRRTSSHMAVVMDGSSVVGLVTLSDVLSGLVSTPQRDEG